MKYQIILFLALLCLNGENFAQEEKSRQIVNKAEILSKDIEDEEIEKQFISQLQNRVTLSGRQTDKIRQLYTDFKKDIVKKKAQRDIRRIELEENLSSAEPDFEFMKIKLKELARINEEIMLSRITVMQKIFELLTLQQREQLKTIEMPSKE